MARKYLKHTLKPVTRTFKVINCPEVEDHKRYAIHRREGLNEYLWPDGTIHNLLVGSVKLGEVLHLEDYPGYFSLKRDANRILKAYEKKQKQEKEAV